MSGSVLDLRPVRTEIEIRAVALGMALHTAHRRCHKAIAFGGLGDSILPRPMTGFALDVGKLRRGRQRLETALIEADDMAANALVVELLVFMFERRHGMRMID